MTILELYNIAAECFLAFFICVSFVFVSATAKFLDNNSKRVFAIYINDLSI